MALPASGTARTGSCSPPSHAAVGSPWRSPGGGGEGGLRRAVGRGGARCGCRTRPELPAPRPYPGPSPRPHLDQPLKTPPTPSRASGVPNPRFRPRQQLDYPRPHWRWAAPVLLLRQPARLPPPTLALGRPCTASPPASSTTPTHTGVGPPLCCFSAAAAVGVLRVRSLALPLRHCAASALPWLPGFARLSSRHHVLRVLNSSLRFYPAQLLPRPPPPLPLLPLLPLLRRLHRLSAFARLWPSSPPSLPPHLLVYAHRLQIC